MLSRSAPFLAPALLVGALVTFAAEPATQPSATQPTSRPSTIPTSKIQRWFDDLAASDAAVRDEGFAALLGLTRADLPALREIVEHSRPVAPSQAAVLHDVVTHVYLSGETYDAVPLSGFLGLLKPDLESVEIPGGNPGEAGDAVSPRTGVPIEYRLPGFCAFRSLRDGDVVIGLLAPNARRLSNWDELSTTIMTFPAGETVVFEVLREGRMLNVSIRLDARPLNANAYLNETIPARETMAEEYWTEHFLPLVEERISAGSPSSQNPMTNQASMARSHGSVRLGH